MGRPFGGGGDDGEPEQLRDTTVEQDSGDEGEEVEEEEDEEGLEGGEHAWLFQQEAAWEDPSADGVLTEVLRAAEEGDAEGLPALLEALSVSVDTLGPDSDTALHLAALYGHSACVRLLLDHGATAGVRDEDGGLALHDAAAGGYTDICEMLLAADASCVNVADEEGDTPLHNAARGGHEDVVRLLVERGADVTLQNEEFKTPAGLAERGTAVKQLLQELERQAAAQGT